MATLLNDDIVNQLREVFEQMQEPVHIFFFGAKENCQYCEDTRQLLEEVTAITDKLSLSVHDVQEDAELAKEHNADKAPRPFSPRKTAIRLRITVFGMRAFLRDMSLPPSFRIFSSFLPAIPG